MAAVRKGLILIVAVALVLDIGALGYIKLGDMSFSSAKKVKLVLWIDDGGQAKEALATVKEQKVEATLGHAKRTFEQEIGFRVAFTSSNVVVKSVEQTLRSSGHSQLSYSKDKTQLFYGGIYAQKTEAQRIKESLAAKEHVNFEVVPGTKTVGKASNKIVVLEIGEDKAGSLIKALGKKGIKIADQVLTPLEPDDAE